MEQDREKIEETVRKCTDRLGGITEAQIQAMISNLMKMGDRKTIVDSLALNVKKFFGKEQQKENFEACMNDLLALSEGSYTSVEQILAQAEENMAKNYTPRKYICRGKSCFSKWYYKNSL